MSLVFPIILIVIGALFLIQSWRPAFDPWSVLSDYWPLLLIFVGLGMVWDNLQRRRNPGAPAGISLGSTMGVLAFVLVLLVLLSHGRSFSRRHGFREGSSHTVQTVDIQGAKKAHGKLEMGAGQLNIYSAASHLVDADFTFSGSFSEPRVNYTVKDGVGELEISQDSQTVHFGNSQNEWNVRFSREIPLELRIDMGAGQGNLHFRDVPLTRLDLNIGAGQVDVDLTGDRKADLVADIEGGVGQANIRLPKNIGVIAHASGGIGSVSARGLKHDGDEYTNEAYGKSPVTIHLKVEGGIGEIVLTEE
ncbi:MAG TPA: toast rack family protein [Candidatus Angelobacter sp.]|nr:toast rack family protein [Candidatus Angelobacter sp.]